MSTLSSWSWNIFLPLATKKRKVWKVFRDLLYELCNISRLKIWHINPDPFMWCRYDTLYQDYALIIPKLCSLFLTPLPPALPPSDLLYLDFCLRRRSLPVKAGVANHILDPEVPLATTSGIFWSLRIPHIPNSQSGSGTKGMFWNHASSQHVQLIFSRKTPVDFY